MARKRTLAGLGLDDDTDGTYEAEPVSEADVQASMPAFSQPPAEPQPAPGWRGSLRRGLQNIGVLGALDEGIPYYLGPHLGGVVDKVGTAAGFLTPGSGTMHDAAEASKQIDAGNYGRAAAATALGTAGGLLDFVAPGSGAGRSILKGMTGGTRMLNELIPSAGAAAALIPSAAKGGEKAAGPIRAYHGSPHDFDKFDLSKIGTGEGAQAYGHGLYFAEKEGTARSYRDALSRNKDYKLASNPDVTLPDWVAQRIQGAKPEHRATVIDGLRTEFAERLAQEQAELKTSIQPWNVEGRIFNMKRILSGLDETAKSPEFLPNGRIYEVAIHADPERFLDWDKPLKEQPAPVREVFSDPQRLGFKPQTLVRSDGKTVSGYWNDQGRSAGTINIGTDQLPASPFHEQSLAQNLYRTLDPQAPQASTVLREAGIPGIKYLDQGSRGTGEGSRNFVTFSDNIVEILRKYGLAGLSALPAAAAGTIATVGASPTPSDAEQALANDNNGWLEQVRRDARNAPRREQKPEQKPVPAVLGIRG